MEIRARDINRELLLEFSGEMDHHGARNALKEVEMAIDSGAAADLDSGFSGVTFMDSSGHRPADSLAAAVAAFGGQHHRP